MTLVSQLEKIESSGLIRLAQQDPELEYVFRHALVQDATYESLLKADRRTLHFAVGETLEGLYADRLDEIAATLGLHFEKAEEFEKAVSYFIRAGEAAARIYAVDEAIELFRHALELYPVSMADDTLAHLYGQYGRVLELAGRFDVVLLVYGEMRAEGIERGNLRMELDALLAEAILHATPTPLSSYTRAVELAERALEIARIVQHPESESRAYWILMLSNIFEGHLENAIHYGEKSLAIAQTLENPQLLAFVLNDIARSYISIGMMDKAIEANAQARTLWRELGNLPMLVDNLGTAAEFKYFRGYYRECITLAQEAYEISKSINNLWGQTMCLMNMGFSTLELGEMDWAIQINNQLLSFDPRGTVVIAQISSRGQLATVYRELGAHQTSYEHAVAALEAAQSLQPALKAAVLGGMIQYHVANREITEAEKLFEEAIQNYSPENFTTYIPQYVEAARHDILMYKQQYSAALEALDKTIAILNRLQIGFCLPEFMFRKAQTLLALAQPQQAREMLESAAAFCEQTESHRLAWRIYSLLGEIQQQSGDAVSASAAWASAKTHIQFIAEHSPAHLRASFLQLPEVSRLLSQ